MFLLLLFHSCVTFLCCYCFTPLQTWGIVLSFMVFTITLFHFCSLVSNLKNWELVMTWFHFIRQATHSHWGCSWALQAMNARLGEKTVVYHRLGKLLRFSCDLEACTAWVLDRLISAEIMVDLLFIHLSSICPGFPTD